MEAYQKRVIDECRELEDKLQKLLEFSATQIFLDLSDEEREMLLRQKQIMLAYTKVLHERINYWKILEQSAQPVL